MTHEDLAFVDYLREEQAARALDSARYEFATRLSPVVTAAIRRAVTAHTERVATTRTIARGA